MQRNLPRVHDGIGNARAIPTVYARTFAIKSDAAKFASKKFVFVRRYRFFFTTMITSRFPAMPIGSIIIAMQRKDTKPNKVTGLTSVVEFKAVAFRETFIFRSS